MFIYLSKKIIVSNNTKILCIDWSKRYKWIAVGGENGLLKILTLDKQGTNREPGNNDRKGSANLSTNQTLDGHSENITHVAWNEKFEKLVSSDESGLIIIWTLHQGCWYEEMVNNRHKSIVRWTHWNATGEKICVAYEDGAIVVGSVDGHRIWGKEFKKMSPTHVQWSPDSKIILLGVRTGDVHICDDEGNFLDKLKIKCLPTSNVSILIAGINWYHGDKSDNCPRLAISYQSGHVQLMKTAYDSDPTILDTSTMIVSSCWNHNGSVLALLGSTILMGENNESNIMQFITPYGEFIRSIRIPGSSSTWCAWEGGSLRLAACVDNNVYFANIHPDHHWCYFADICVYCDENASIGNGKTAVTFWNTKTNKKFGKTTPTLLFVAAFGDKCVLATCAEDDSTSSKFRLMVCDALATPVDYKYADLTPKFVCMNEWFVFAASRDAFLVWPFQHSGIRKRGKDRIYHADDTPSGVSELADDSYNHLRLGEEEKSTKDGICCMAASNAVLLVGKASGIVQRYDLPKVALVQRISTQCHPRHLTINCDSTKMCVVDVTGILSLYTIETDLSGNKIAERKDTWNVKWAEDDPQLLATMEKSRMYILRDGLPEEPIDSMAHIARFHNLEITSILLDQVMFGGNESSEYVLHFEVKSLRDTRQLLQKVGLDQAVAFVENNPHPRLWSLVAEMSLRCLNTAKAETAFVHCRDYAGIHLVKKIDANNDERLKKAMVYAHYGDFAEAERLYIGADRNDLAVAMRRKLGDWFRAVELMKLNSATTDAEFHQAWNAIGDAFYERRDWFAAKEYYAKTGNYERLVECERRCDNYKALARLADVLPSQHPLLERISHHFANAGMSSQALAAMAKLPEKDTRSGAISKICCNFNEWKNISSDAYLEKAFHEGLKHATHNGRFLEASRMNAKAGRWMEAARLVHVSSNADLAIAKKAAILRALLLSKTSTDEQVWREAEAFHLASLALLQLPRDATSAMRTSLHLKTFENELGVERTYALVAVCALAAGALETASKAFLELETRSSKGKMYEKAAVAVFGKFPPDDGAKGKEKCPCCGKSFTMWERRCEECGDKNVYSVASGKLMKRGEAWQCGTCKHFASYAEISERNSCPLCHAAVTQ